jgi:pimeloyl-ACP methyl ester carboxylesterase
MKQTALQFIRITLAAMIGLILTTTATMADTFVVKVRPRGLGKPAVYVKVNTDTLTNPNPGSGGVTILTVHGMAHTGNSFIPLSGELFANQPNGIRVKRVINLDLPGHGSSTLLPKKMSVKFGDLTIDDYARVLTATLDHYRGASKPTVLFGHSMGGLVIQVAQEQLLNEGKNLRSKSITDVIVIASASPSAVPDPFLESGAGIGLLSYYTQPEDPTLGTYVSIDPGSFLTFFYTTDAAGDFAPGTPSFEQLAAAGYQSDESYTAAVQTVGLAAMRPAVRTGAFAPEMGTRLKVMVGNHDPFNDPAQHADLYRYLTGDASLTDFIVIDDPYAVHDQLISDPGAIINAL